MTVKRFTALLLWVLNPFVYLFICVYPRNLFFLFSLFFCPAVSLSSFLPFLVLSFCRHLSPSLSSLFLTSFLVYSFSSFRRLLFPSFLSSVTCLSLSSVLPCSSSFIHSFSSLFHSFVLPSHFSLLPFFQLSFLLFSVFSSSILLPIFPSALHLPHFYHPILLFILSPFLPFFPFSVALTFLPSFIPSFPLSFLPALPLCASLNLTFFSLCLHGPLTLPVLPHAATGRRGVRAVLDMPCSSDGLPGGMQNQPNTCKRGGKGVR